MGRGEGTRSEVGEQGRNPRSSTGRVADGVLSALPADGGRKDPLEKSGRSRDGKGAAAGPWLSPLPPSPQEGRPSAFSRGRVRPRCWLLPGIPSAAPQPCPCPPAGSLALLPLSVLHRQAYSPHPPSSACCRCWNPERSPSWERLEVAAASELGEKTATIPSGPEAACRPSTSYLRALCVMTSPAQNFFAW